MCGVVYMISSPNTDKVYIGSTIRKLSRRFYDHMCISNDTQSKIIIESGNATITAIDSVEDDDLEELKIKELEYIRFYKNICVNITGTKDSYSENYKPPCVLDGRYKEHQNTKNDCFICGGRYSNNKKATHFRTKKHINGIKSLM